MELLVSQFQPGGTLVVEVGQRSFFIGFGLRGV